MKGWEKIMNLNDIVTVKGWWLKPVEQVRCEIVNFWSDEKKFIDVRPLCGEQKIRVVRAEDVIL